MQMTTQHWLTGISSMNCRGSKLLIHPTGYTFCAASVSCLSVELVDFLPNSMA